ncbi:hypothetical protein AJ78_09028 [Emergomyces pasteurianus Ep9510]|uniref:PNPLA domain-containing protein n=1 Tax=Emergomyces pasteurianus Ep9510 TaxID=1447872 RepID=A0A1J9P148_9EURO|nr:hypothetical protein AJ78_09028 [Emergomyces pasteurianus Ep9510]
MQDILGPELLVLSLTDFIAGTSSGGIIALNMEKCQHSVKVSKEVFCQLTKQFFSQDQRNSNRFGRLFGTWFSDGMYDARNLEEILVGHFGTMRMLSTPPIKVLN